MREITLEKFLGLYEASLVCDVVVIRNRIIGKSVEGMGDSNGRFEVVWAVLP